MSIAIITRPDRVHKSDATKISRWVCAHHPIYFDFERTDYSIFGINNIGGFIQLVVGGALPLDIVVGAIIYVKGNSNYVEATGNVTAVNSLALYYTLQTDIPCPTPTGSPLGGYFNVLSRLNYHVQVTCNVFNPATGLTVPFSGRFTPDAKGKGRFYAEELVKSALRKINSFQYNAINKLDVNSWGRFYLSTTEKWKGNVPVTVIDGGGSNPTYYDFADSTKYLLDEYGQNMCDFLPFLGEVAVKAKFLTNWKNPTRFMGYPFALGFIYPQELYSVAMTAEETRYSEALANLGTTNTQIDVSQVGGINFLTLRDDAPVDTGFVDVWLKVGGLEQRSYTTSGYAEAGYFEVIPPSLPDPNPQYDITEKKRVKIAYPCAENPVYLRWRNNAGSWDCWLFEHRVRAKNKNKTLGSYSTNEDNLEIATSRDRVTQMQSGNSLILLDYVAMEDWEGIKGIYESPEIEMLIDLPTLKFLSVQVTPDDYEYKRDVSMVDFKIQIDLPDRFTIPN